MVLKNYIQNVTEQENYHQLKSNLQVDETRFIKQRSDIWLTIRKDSMVTGSTCNKALGLETLKQQQLHYLKVTSRAETEHQVESFSDQQLQNMEYGTKHEIDAIATMVGRVMPALFPNIEYFEEGCIRMALNENPSFFVTSPDGSFRASDEPTFMYENKCKTKNVHSMNVYYEIPRYYVPQLLSDMKGYNCRQLLFSCWSEQSSCI